MANNLKTAIENNQPQVISDYVQFDGRAVDGQHEDDGYTLLSRATHYGRAEIVEILLRKGSANPSKPCRNSNTPLHIAVNYKFKKIQDLLLEFEADELKLNDEGLLPWEGIIKKSMPEENVDEVNDDKDEPYDEQQDSHNKSQNSAMYPYYNNHFDLSGEEEY